MTEKLSILGSTGSIGKHALDVCEKAGIKVTALTANSSCELLEEQARRFKPKKVALADEKKAAELKIRLADTAIKVLAGKSGVCECAAEEAADTVLNGIVGMAGLEPTLCALNEKKSLALANKETLVTAGHLIMPLARKEKVSILPVDSEHSAIFQSMHGENRERVSKILLTASGGPFRGKKREELEKITVVRI